MQDALAPKKKSVAPPIAEVEETPAASAEASAGGPIAEQLQNLFGNQVVEEALAGGGGPISSFASVLRDASELGASGVGNAGPLGMLAGNQASDLANQARTFAQGALQGSAQALQSAGGGDFMQGLGEMSNLFSGVAMRDAKGPSGGFDQLEVSGNIQRSNGASLPASLATRLSMLLGTDMSKVRIHTGEAAAQASESLNAHAFALGSDVFFGPGQFRPGTPEGDALIIHELTHVVQAQQGRLPTATPGSGITTSAPSDSAEVEATSSASSLAGMLQLPDEQFQQMFEGVIKPLQQGLGGGMAMRSATSGTTGAASSTKAPESIQLILGGKSFRAKLPSGAKANTEVSVDIQNTVAGVTFNSATVKLDNKFKPQSGNLTYTFQVGDMVGPGNGTATLTGNAAAVKANAVPLRLASLATGQINVHLSTAGVVGGGQLQGNQFTLKNNFSSNGGSVAVELDAKGNINGKGQITGSVTNVGTAKVEARVTNTNLAGLANIELNPNTSVVTGVTLTKGQLTGTYEHTAGTTQVQGGVSADVRGFMKADIQGGMDTAQRNWNVTGQVSQTQPYALGNVTFDKGNLEVNVQEGSAGPMQGEFEYTYQQFKGTLNGTYDPATNQGNGQISAKLHTPKPLGAAGELTTANATGTMTNSQFESVTGSFSGKLNLANKPTFQADLTQGNYTASSNQVSGESSFTLLRDLTAPEQGGGGGGGGGGHVKVPSGATATASVAANKITTVNGELQYQAADGAGQFGEGTVQANFADGNFSGQGNFTLSTNYGIPQRSDTSRFVKSGAKLTANVSANTLQTVQLQDVGFTIKNTGAAGQLDGSAQGSLEVPAPQMTGNVNASVAQAWDVPVSFGTFQLTQGGTATAAIEANNIQKVGLNVPFKSDITGATPVSVSGTVKGDYTTATSSLTGEATGTLTKDVPIKFANGDTLTVLTGAAIKLPVNNNQVSKVDLTNVTVKYADANGPVATGTFKGSIAVPAMTTTGDADLTLTRDLSLGEGAQGTRLENWQAFIDSGSKIALKLQNDAPQAVQVNASGHLKASGDKVATGKIEGTLKLAEGKHDLSGTAGAKLIKEVKLKQGERFTAFLGTETDATATLSASKIQSAEGTFEVVAKEGDTAKAKAAIQTTYQAGSGVSGSASINVVDDIDVIKGSGSEKLVVEKGKSTATATVTSDELTSVNGSIGLRYDDTEGALLRGSFTADWKPKESNTLSGTASITTLRDYQMGPPSPTGMKFTLDKGASISATLTESKLNKLVGSANVTVAKDAAFAKGSLQGTYLHDGKKFTGTGAATITQAQDLGAVYAGGKAILVPGAGATAKVTDSELNQLTGTVPIQIDDNQAGENFASVLLEGKYTHAPKQFLGRGSAQINKEKKVAEASGFKVFLEPASNATVEVENNELIAINGTVKMRADDAKGKFAKAEISGGWRRDGGMNGTGTATLMVDQYEVGRVGGYTVYVTKGAGVSLTVANSAPTKLTGTVPFKVDGSQGAFLKGSVSNAVLDLQAKKLSGSANMEIVTEQNLGTIAQTTLILKAGSGVTGTFADNQLTEVGGQLGLLLRRPSDIASATFKGKMTLADKPQMTGTGQVTLLEEVTLLDRGAYAFSLAKDGTSAKIAVTNNNIDSISGSVGFRVKKDGKAFVKGAVTGDWDVAADAVSGTGSAQLEAVQEFANGRIKVLPGTSATATVKTNELKEITGSLKADLYATGGAGAGGGALAQAQAQGTIDVSVPSIKSLTGSVKFNRALRPFDGLEIKDITGSVEVKNDQIIKAGGAGTVSAPIIKLTGAFEGFWKNEGEDKYWGKATANLDLGKKLSGHSARGVTGVSVRGELFESGDFTLGGKVNYAITDKIKGDIDIENKGREINPKLGGTLQASGTLVEGRELFKWEKDLLTGNVMAGPIPIAYGVKGAMGLTMKPVTFDTSFGIQNFYPLQLNVPDFNADLQLNGGASFFASVLPYVGVGVSFANDIFTAMGGLEGQAKAQVDLDLGMQGKLKGEGGQYSGELGIGATVTPSATLSLTPFAEFRLLGMGGRHDFANFSYTFNDLFEMKWETTYKFGDQGPTDQAGAANTRSSNPGTNQRISQNPAKGSETIRPSLGVGNNTAGKSGPEGGPQIGGSEQQSGEGQTPETPSQIRDILDKATKLADGVKGIKRIVDVLGQNPVSAAVDVVLNWDQIVEAVNQVKTAINVVADLIRPLLPSWWETLKGWIERGKNALGQAAGMVLDGGRWLVESGASALRSAWNWVWGS